MSAVSTSTDHRERIVELQRQIDELKKSWPAHSVPAALLQRLEDLESELEAELSAGQAE